MIPNYVAKDIVRDFRNFAVVVGGYARDSHKDSYKDLDFLSMDRLGSLLHKIGRNYKYKVLKQGEKYISLELDDKYLIDIWKTNKQNFAKDYLLRYLPKHQVINLHKQKVI
jgi:hypothetical protein